MANFAIGGAQTLIFQEVIIYEKKVLSLLL
jgi:hypothetical protein